MRLLDEQGVIITTSWVRCSAASEGRVVDTVAGKCAIGRVVISGVAHVGIFAIFNQLDRRPSLEPDLVTDNEAVWRK